MTPRTTKSTKTSATTKAATTKKTAAKTAPTKNTAAAKPRPKFFKSRELTSAEIRHVLPGIEQIDHVKVTVFPKWSLVKRAPATEEFTGREVIIIRRNAQVVANVFATADGEKLNAYFPAQGRLSRYSTKHTQVNAIRMALNKA